MTIERGPAILVVEDVDDIREQYIRGLRRAGFNADGAASKNEAFEQVKRQTYHVAMIDLNLLDKRSDIADRSGLDVIRLIKELGEGTRCLVVSAQKDIDSGLGAMRAGMDDFLKKTDVRGESDFVTAVSNLAEKVQFSYYGPYEHLHAYLCRPEGRDEWESIRMSVLKLDSKRFFDVLQTAFAPIVPVLRAKNSNVSLNFDHSKREIAGLFWSKRLGSAVEIRLFADTGDSRDRDARETVIVDQKKYGVRIKVRTISGLDRDKFEERIRME